MFLSVTPSPNPTTQRTAAPPARPVRGTPRRATKPKSKSKPPSRRRTVARFLPQPDPSSREYHQRKCQICKHPRREEIAEDFINWAKPDHIVEFYELEGYRAVYRPAHATGLFDRRRLNLGFAAETLVEEVNCVDPCADACSPRHPHVYLLGRPRRLERTSQPRHHFFPAAASIPSPERPLRAESLPALALNALVHAQSPHQVSPGVEIVLDPSPSPETGAPSSDRHFAQSENESK